MEIIDKFGLDPILLFAQIVNFLVIFYLLKRFAYKPIMEVLDKREHTIREGLKQAEDARIAYEKAIEKEKEILRIAQSEARTLMEDTKKQAANVMQQTKEETRKQVERMLTEAREQIVYESKEAEKRLTAHVGRIALHMLEKSAESLFTKQDQEAVVKRAVKYIREKDKTN